jgi:hypothetical protein
MTTHTIRSDRRTGDRSITTRFLLDDTAQPDRDGDEVRFALELTTHHDKDRKRYVSRASRSIVGPVFTRHIFGFRDPQPPLPAQAVTVARYSARGLDDAHTAFESTAADTATFEALLAWAADQRADD